MIVAIVAGVIAFMVVAIVLARNTSSRKQQAIESLKAEKAAVGHYNILDLIDEEVKDLELRSIEGATGIPPDVLLKTWTDSPELHDVERSELRYVVAEGVEPQGAERGDVTLIRVMSSGDEPDPSS